MYTCNQYKVTAQCCLLIRRHEGIIPSTANDIPGHEGIIPSTANDKPNYSIFVGTRISPVINVLKSYCFKRDLKELKLGAVTIISESEFHARVARLVKKIDFILILLGSSLTLQLLFCRCIRIIYYKVVCKDHRGVTI